MNNKWNDLYTKLYDAFFHQFVKMFKRDSAFRPNRLFTNVFNKNDDASSLNKKVSYEHWDNNLEEHTELVGQNEEDKINIALDKVPHSQRN